MISPLVVSSLPCLIGGDNLLSSSKCSSVLRVDVPACRHIVHNLDHRHSACQTASCYTAQAKCKPTQPHIRCNCQWHIWYHTSCRARTWHQGCEEPDHQRLDLLQQAPRPRKAQSRQPCCHAMHRRRCFGRPAACRACGCWRLVRGDLLPPIVGGSGAVSVRLRPAVLLRSLQHIKFLSAVLRFWGACCVVPQCVVGCSMVMHDCITPAVVPHTG